MSRLSTMVMVYAMIGMLLFVSGVIPSTEVGVVEQFVDEDALETDDVQANEEQVNADNGGLLANLVDPIQNALSTVAGGTVLAVLNKINVFLGYVTWPFELADDMGMPWQLDLLFSTTSVILYTFGGLKVLKSSV